MAGDGSHLIIFDCDGVLVDSEMISFSVLHRMLADVGADVPLKRAYHDFLGKSLASVTKLVAEEFCVQITDKHLQDMRLELYARFEKELRPMPGLRNVLASLEADRCVASSSQPERIRLSLATTGLIDFFEPHIFSATMVDHGKPAPDLFFHAANAMGRRPEDCLVIEDSPAGVTAAKAAGMKVFAFVGGAHAGPCRLREQMHDLKPDTIFDDMSKLPALIAAWS